MARLWIDATYLKVRRGGRIVAVAAIIAVGVNPDGRRAVLGMEVGTAEAEPIWTEFLGKLTRWGLRGVKPVISVAQRAGRLLKRLGRKERTAGRLGLHRHCFRPR